MTPVLSISESAASLSLDSADEDALEGAEVVLPLSHKGKASAFLRLWSDGFIGNGLLASLATSAASGLTSPDPAPSA